MRPRRAVALASQLAEPEARFRLAQVYGGRWMVGPGGARIALAAGYEDPDRLLAGERDAVWRKPTISKIEVVA